MFCWCCIMAPMTCFFHSTLCLQRFIYGWSMWLWCIHFVCCIIFHCETIPQFIQLDKFGVFLVWVAPNILLCLLVSTSNTISKAFQMPNHSIYKCQCYKTVSTCFPSRITIHIPTILCSNLCFSLIENQQRGLYMICCLHQADQTRILFLVCVCVCCCCCLF